MSSDRPQATLVAAVTGAFGYTGRHVAALLLEGGHQVRTLTGHPGRDCFEGRVPAWPLDFSDEAGLARSLFGVDVLFNTYWVRFARDAESHAAAVRHTRALFRAAATAGVRRVVHVSITGASARSPLPYFRGKGELEEVLRASGLGYAVVRPSLLFGGREVLVNNIAWILRRFPVYPIFGSGDYPVQPVHVQDVARLAVEAGAKSGNLTVDAVGPETLTFYDLVQAVAAAVGSHALVVSAPPGAVHALGRLLGAAVGDVVVTRDEIRGLMAGLLVAEEAPAGRIGFRPWLAAHGQGLGVRYASELARHYRP